MRQFLRSKRVRKWGSVALVSLIVFGIFKYVQHRLDQPAYGSVTVSHQTANTPLTDSTDYSALNTDYFSVLYPSVLTPDYPLQKSTGFLTYNYLTDKDARQNVRASLEVYLKPLPYGGIVLDGDYKFYQSQPKIYKLGQKFVRAEIIDVASRNSGQPERTALWAHGNYLLILKLKSHGKGTIDQTFTTILDSVQWLKR